MKTAAIIVAAGQGLRAGTDDVPKQYRRLQGKAVLRYSMEAFLRHPAVDCVVVVIGRDATTLYDSVASQHDKLLPPVLGGPTRQVSVRQGLAALEASGVDRVLIHDAARPFITPGLISRVIDGLDAGDAVLPARPVTSTLKAVDETGAVTGTIPREGLFTAETPQGFRFDAILNAHDAAARSDLVFSDDAGIAEWAKIPVRVVEGDIGNVKLTTIDDFVEAARRVGVERMSGEIRTGIGYDVHAFGPGHEVMLGGVSIPHSKGLIGHSDADVALHALTDAIFGALGDGDIGSHFPPSEPAWRGASSDRFLAFAAGRVAERGGSIAHLDIAIVAEAPRIAAHRETMRARIAAICGVNIGRVGVKATTSEGLGFVGRNEGIAATAIATIRLPFEDLP